MRTSVKTCFKCGQSKARTEFYRHSQMGDGLLGKCKECTKRDVMAHREIHIERIREYDKSRYCANEKRKAQLGGLRKRQGSGKMIAAARMLANAVRSGKVKKSEACWHCGATGRLDGHHVLYDMPLDVIWLCRSCHCKVHRQTVLCDQQATG
jgi:hypothetical protein